MANPNIKPRFKKGGKEASDAGKKSKRGVSLVNALKELLADKKEKKITPELIARAVALNIIKGNAGMAKLAFEYLDGKVPDRVQTDITLRIGSPPKPPAANKKKQIRKKKVKKKKK